MSKITRITISGHREWDTDKVSELMREYNIERHNVISVVHDGSSIYLYYWINH